MHLDVLQAIIGAIKRSLIQAFWTEDANSSLDGEDRMLTAIVLVICESPSKCCLSQELAPSGLVARLISTHDMLLVMASRPKHLRTQTFSVVLWNV